jgi:hypothetical protein
MHNAAPAEYLGQAALVTHQVLKIPQRRLVASVPIDSQGMTVFLRAFLVPVPETHNAAPAE